MSDLFLTIMALTLSQIFTQLKERFRALAQVMEIAVFLSQTEERKRMSQNVCGITEVC